MTREIKRILIANRGEIAVRVIRTCRDLGIESVAVYSDPDRSSLHVRLATYAFHIGKASPKESYLNIEKIVEVAKKAKVDAVHPGYGFLSENPFFAKALEKAGIILIGPKSSSMESMGTKTSARKVMINAKVPVVPGVDFSIIDEKIAFKTAKEIGFPVMLKAVYGGGGKGMRKVDKEEDFASLWAMVQSESKNSFGNNEVYIEKYLDKPRHIEMQILADAHGKVIPFVERECSIQRRHQKLIEETPSPFVDKEMRKEMAEVAINAAKAVDYIGAGTIEFLVDSKKNFYFMEMNTRLQVEHPITEMVSGLDLVAEQIAISEGKPLADYDFINGFDGWAMEARVCAEDPAQDFLPTPGPVHHLRFPDGPYTRSDSGLFSGSEITTDYDPMIAKIIAWGKNRQVARKRLDRALMEFTLKGCTTNAMFLRQILHFAPFIDGDYDTNTIVQFKKEKDEWVKEEHKIVALLGSAIFSFEKEKALLAKTKVTAPNHPRGQISSWRRM